jgi:hypothetical protein
MKSENVVLRVFQEYILIMARMNGIPALEQMDER